MAASNKRIRSQSKRKFLLFLAGLATIFPIIRFLGFSVPKKPKIVEVAKTLQDGEFFVAPEFILFEQNNQSWAVSRRCTHLGCTVNFHEKEKIIECPCHQSRFTTTGEVLRGPATRNLSSFGVEKLEGGGYLVTI